ncbi:MAG: hypothetical protein IIA82_11175 [Thaumarchaeota archaeon]|nr:hypothetical protein [Nitrososphaerota archaeon]
MKQTNCSYFALIALLLLVPLLALPSFASTETQLEWQLVFLSDKPGCSNYHYSTTLKYAEITEGYLGMYGVDNFKHPHMCVPDAKYFEKYTMPDSLDLLILVYDRDLGERELHANGMGGFYSHLGEDQLKNHVIVFCDCSNFYFSNPEWILSHELSHFILYYKGYNLDTIDKFVHQYDERYDYCMDEIYEPSCVNSRVKLRAGANNWSVIPLYSPAINNIADPANQEKQGTLFFADSQIGVNETFLNKIISKKWSQEKFNMLLSRAFDYSGTRADYYVKAIDDNSGNSDGKSFLTTVNFSDVVIPSWVKDVAGFWCGDEIDNASFIETIQYLINNDVIMVPATPSSGSDSQEIPNWIKSNTCWWSQGLITNSVFASGLEYFIG